MPRSVSFGIIIDWACLGLLLNLFAAHAHAQSASTADRGQELNEKLEVVGEMATDDAKKTDKKSRSLLIVPIPQSSPTLGTGLTLAASVFYNPNNSRDPWITGIGAMRTSNESWALGAVHKMTLANDKHRVTAFAGYADINIKFYGVGPAAGDRDVFVELNDKGYAGMIQAQTRIAKHLYIGPRFQYLDVTSSISENNPLFSDAEIPHLELEGQLAQFGPTASYDSRDSGLTPRTGTYVTATWLFSAKVLGGDYSHNKFTLNGNIYRPVAKNTVIAARASICGVSTGSPFYDLCLYGASSDLRGYATGRYRDRASWATQIEVRQHLFGRFGVVAFAGVGASAPSLENLDEGRLLPSFGAGLRFQPTKSTPVNLRIDYAIGRGSQALYLGIGEAF